ncbi:hypothetical protein CTAYLR_004464 [Chrysophaeum taylorii]|uniref:AB hydrolase-1 domain-containing protein n=1 Tax=Chrysophaeum taylorii TaxID=2483200 RepID=A0AAD7UDV5_9STRA|nr:hypothetical protein CTAYLR_004464 [Chrysophaeum taylorii]
MIFFVHGSHHDAGYWTGMQAEFSRRGFESRALDLGSSRWATVASLVRRLRDEIHDESDGGADAVYVGHSQGALVVQSHLATGGRARAAILMAPVPLDTLLWLRHSRSLATSVPPANLVASALTLNSKYVVAPDVETMRANFFLPTTKSTTRSEFGNSLEEYFLHEITPEDTVVGSLFSRGNARDISVPTLLVAAEQDKLVGVDTVVALGRLIPNAAEVCVVSEQAHAFSDPGWEDSVCGPMETFLRSTAGVP